MKNRNDNKPEQGLSEGEKWCRWITETSVDAIITADARDHILTWNRGAQVIFGYGQDIVGQPVATIIPRRYREAHREGIKRFLKTGERRIIGRSRELQAIRRDGAEFPIELSLSTWNGPSGVHFGAIIRDISERKRIEQIQEDVQRMMRHDLKSPLVGITGLAKVLQRSHSLTERQQKAAALIHDLGKKTLRRIGRSRDLFHMEQGIYKLVREPVDLVSLLKHIHGELVPLFRRKSLGMEINIRGRKAGKDTEYIVQGDEDLLDMMLANLIKNAVEASPDGGVIEVNIDPEWTRDQERHIIDIHNPGVIPEEVRETFFEPYTTSGKKRGTGLGTHSARLIARTHGGDIDFTTSKKEGTHVSIEIPPG